jgi:hypothetical protein
MTTPNDSMQIDASPTKELFIDMLVRDSPLIPAIIGLVDNAVDGALRQRHDNYSGFSIHIELDSNRFKIVDNCGGIPVNVARDYAFRFGKMNLTPSSVGQFGMGMKRVFFRLGKKFRVESTTKNAHFVVEADVDEWKQQPNWHFQFQILEENLADVPPEKRGTTITVTNLHQDISNKFKLENFKTLLHRELAAAHSINMEKGLVIILNAIPLKIHPLLLLHSEQIQPFFKEEIVYHEDTPIRVKIFAGIAERSPSDSGWYIFCNGRMVLKADKTHVTGWGELNGSLVPKYHDDFAYFRGYIFFDSDDARLLPWTTTKMLAIDFPLFRGFRLDMTTLMPLVIDFLRKLATEKSRKELGKIDETPLVKALESAELKHYSEISTPNRFFKAPESPLLPEPPTRWIGYRKPDAKFKKVQEVVGAKTPQEVGEATFEYFFQLECDY